MSDEYVLVPEKIIAKLSCELEHGEPADWYSAAREAVNSVTKPPEVQVEPDYPECSGDPASCPENEGRGCCNPNPKLHEPVAFGISYNKETNFISYLAYNARIAQDQISQTGGHIVPLYTAPPTQTIDAGKVREILESHVESVFRSPHVNCITEEEIPEICGKIAALVGGCVVKPDCCTSEFDDYSIDQFAYAMKAKMAKKRDEGRGGWEHCDPELLSKMLFQHISKGDPIDVANFCMMLHQTKERIVAQLEPISCSERFPTEEDADPFSKVLAASKKEKTWGVWNYMTLRMRPDDFVCWLPTGLKQPPAPGESE